jgi:hypothetical protein
MTAVAVTPMPRAAANEERPVRQGAVQRVAQCLGFKDHVGKAAGCGRLRGRIFVAVIGAIGGVAVGGRCGHRKRPP